MQGLIKTGGDRSHSLLMTKSLLSSTLETMKEGQKVNHHTQSLIEPQNNRQKPFHKLTSEFHPKEHHPLQGKCSVLPPKPQAQFFAALGILDTPPVLFFLLTCGWALLVEPSGVHCSG